MSRLTELDLLHGLRPACISLWNDFAAGPRNIIVSTKIWNDFLFPASIDTVNGVNKFHID